MNFNVHSALSGKHAFLSPSNYHWINYTEDKLEARWYAATAAARGVSLHEYAQRAILLGIKQADSDNALNRYINDAIGYKMNVEQILFYSFNCFGTADAISFRNNMLRIHDLKTGITATSHKQLEVYAAIFCLEYEFSPFDIDMELRIYQREDIRIHIPEPDVVIRIMDKIVIFDKQIEMLKEGGFL